MVVLGLLGLLAMVDLLVAYRLWWGFAHFTLKLPRTRLPESELPTVSICIPARNERHAMTSCLETVVASDYPKLEVIVLDDGSRDDTSLLIKSFAHAGVRFVEGSPLPTGWLGKNHALDVLVKQASGQYVLLMDVDTRLQPQTVTRLVHYLLSEKVDMVSVLPLRHDSWRASVVFATMRFFWEIIWHRRARPAAASTAWMVKRSVLLEELGGMAAYATDTRPDAAVARTLAAQDRYRFVISSPMLGLRYEKRWHSQAQTSIRLAFPLLGSSWLKVAVVAAALLMATYPYIYMIAGVWLSPMSLLVAAYMLGIGQILLYGWFVSRVWPRGWIVGACVLPLLLLIEVWLVLASGVGYTRRSITWKGRPVAGTVATLK